MKLLTFNNDNIVQATFDRFEIINDKALGGDVFVAYNDNVRGYAFFIQNFPAYTVSDVTSLPSDFEIYKYCYTKEKGFYLNPNWVEPTPPAEKYTLDEVATMIASEVNK